MELKFTKDGEKFISEFTATADFNLHLEGVVEGNVKVYQRSTAGGEYAYVRGATPYPSFSDVYDYDFSALVYPKSIKVVTNVEPVVAEVVTDGEVIPSAGGGSGDEYEYVDVSSLTTEQKLIILYFATTLKSEMEDMKAIQSGPYVALSASGNPDSLRELAALLTAVCMPKEAYAYLLKEDSQSMAQMFEEKNFLETYNSLPRITKEEFYNLN